MTTQKGHTKADAKSDTPDDARKRALEALEGTAHTSADEPEGGAAAALLLKVRSRDERKETTARHEDLAHYQYFYRCGYCNGHGIYFKKNPIGLELSDEDWFSTYKDEADPYSDDTIYCQECLLKNMQTGLRVVRRAVGVPRPGQAARVGRTFHIGQKHLRFMCKFPLDEEERDRTPVLSAGDRGERS